MNGSQKLSRLVTLCERHAGEERLVRFPAPGGRPSINHFSRKPGQSQPEIVPGRIRVAGPSATGSYMCTLERTDGGNLTRPSSATGFGDVTDTDTSAGSINAVVDNNGVRVMVGDSELEGVEPRAAEHFTRVVLTFLTRTDQ